MNKYPCEDIDTVGRELFYNKYKDKNTVYHEELYLKRSGGIFPVVPPNMLHLQLIKDFKIKGFR